MNKNNIKNIVKRLPSTLLVALCKIKILSPDFVYKLAINVKKRKELLGGYSSEYFCLNIGAGLGVFNKRNWRILDYSEDSNSKNLIDYNVNLLNMRKLDIEDNSVDLIYSSHCFEHITDDAFERIMSEAYRIMKCGATFRITLPNIDVAYDAYLRRDRDMLRNHWPDNGMNNEDLFLRWFSGFDASEINIAVFKNDIKKLSKDIFLDKYTKKDIDFEIHDFGKHINWFDFEKIKKYALLSGFCKADIMESAYKRSVNPELRTELFDASHPEMSLYVDIVKRQSKKNI